MISTILKAIASAGVVELLDVELSNSTAFALLAVLIAVLVASVVLARAWRRRRWARLRARAARLGWQPITGPMPAPVAEALGSRRCQIALGARHQGHRVWMVYHRWSGEKSRTHELTRYFLELGPGFPDIRLHHRPDSDEPPPEPETGEAPRMREFDTGFDKFERRFRFVAPDEFDPLPLLTPALQKAMVSGYLPLWEIAEGVLVTRHPDEPGMATLRSRADGIVHLAGMLTRTRV